MSANGGDPAARIQDWHGMVTSILDGCLDAIKTCDDQVAALEESVQSATEALQTIGDETDERLGTLDEDVDTWSEAIDEELERQTEIQQTLLASLQERIEETWSAFTIDVARCGDEARRAFERLFEDEAARAIAAVEDDVVSALRNSDEASLSQSDTLRIRVAEAFGELSSQWRDDMVAMVNGQVREFGEAVLDRVKQEVAAGLLTSQVQTQLTAALAPILPQLVAAKAAASAIRQALEFMRAGGL